MTTLRDTFKIMSVTQENEVLNKLTKNSNGRDNFKKNEHLTKRLR